MIASDDLTFQAEVFIFSVILFKKAGMRPFNFFKWAKPALFLFIFVLFSDRMDKYSTNLTINEKSVDGMLGTRTQGSRMEGADESTELWRHPIYFIFWSNFPINVVVAQLVERSLHTPEVSVQIQSAANFYIEHMFTVNCIEKMKIKKKSAVNGEILFKKPFRLKLSRNDLVISI